MASQLQRVVVITGASRGLGVRASLAYFNLLANSANPPKLEWVKQLSQDPNNFVVAVVRNPDKADLLAPLLGPRVVSVQGDVADIDSFPVGFKYRLHIASPD